MEKVEVASRHAQEKTANRCAILRKSQDDATQDDANRSSARRRTSETDLWKLALRHRARQTREPIGLLKTRKLVSCLTFSVWPWPAWAETSPSPGWEMALGSGSGAVPEPGNDPG